MSTVDTAKANEARELRITFRELWDRRNVPSYRLWLRYATKRLRELRP